MFRNSITKLLLVVSAIAALIVPAMATGGGTGVDWGTIGGEAKTEIMGTVSSLAPVVLPIVAVGIGLALFFKLTRKAAK